MLIIWLDICRTTNLQFEIIFQEALNDINKDIKLNGKISINVPFADDFVMLPRNI